MRRELPSILRVLSVNLICRGGGGFLCLPILCATLVTRTFAAGSETPGALQQVVPPGQEELLAKILGRGATLPGDCRLTGGKADGAIVTAEYACGGREVVLELRPSENAPPTAVRTERFAIVPRSGFVPPGLTEALASLIRRNEQGFHWKQTAGPRSTVARMIRLLAVGAGLLGILVVGLAVQFLGRRRLPAAGTWPRSPAIALPMVLVSAGALCALAHAALRAAGILASALLWHGGGAEVRLSLGPLAALVPPAMLAATVTAWLAPRWRLRAAVATTVIVYLVVGHRLTVLPDDLHYFGALSTLPPNVLAPPVTAGTSAIVYRTNGFGFREPAFAAVKTTGVVRLALIGDSFVYGIGVSEDGTLRARLAEALTTRWPQHRFEILNLGIPGNNLASHVELFAAATARLHLDAVVLCLTLANDLSRWDAQVERQAARRLGVFSLARFLTGDVASSLWAAARLETTITPAGLAFLDDQLKRFEEIRRGATDLRVVQVFAFHEWDPAVIARLKRIPETAVVPDGTIGFEDFIAGDGHPTASGNARSAQRITETLGGSPSWLALLLSAPGR